MIADSVPLRCGEPQERLGYTIHTLDRVNAADDKTAEEYGFLTSPKAPLLMYRLLP